MTPKTLFTVFARAEMFTWATLILALVLRAAEVTDAMVLPAGATHGFVFLSYGVTVILVGFNQRWPMLQRIVGVVLAIVPFATYPFERYLEKRNALDGAWRTEPTDDARDGRWLDRVYRWWIARPVVLLFALVLIVSLVFTVLLMAGPPTEWGNR